MRLNPLSYRFHPNTFRILVPIPWKPSRLMKANASTTPPMLAATPLNAATTVRNHLGRFAVAAA